MDWEFSHVAGKSGSDPHRLRTAWIEAVAKGGVGMAKSTIDAIREVEQQTMEAEKKAAADARELASKTKDDAEAIIREAVKKAQSDAQTLLQEAEAKQKELIDQKSEETKKAVEKLKEAAAPKCDAAVKAVLALASGSEG